jgi:hypothetical protein
MPNCLATLCPTCLTALQPTCPTALRLERGHTLTPYKHTQLAQLPLNCSGASGAEEIGGGQRGRLPGHLGQRRMGWQVCHYSAVCRSDPRQVN